MKSFIIGVLFGLLFVINGLQQQPSVIKLCRKKYDLELQSPIGEGASGIVYKAFTVKNRKPFAIKVTNSTSEHEFKMIKLIGRHRNIVRVFCTQTIDSKAYIVMEYCSNGTLKSFMKEHGRMDENKAMGIITQLLSGLKYLRGRKIVHRDIKPANLLFSSDGVLKIADFDSAERLGKDGMVSTSFPGTPLYAAPEIHGHFPHTCLADLWSAGIILFELMTGIHPFLFDDENPNLLVRHIVDYYALNSAMNLPRSIKKSPALEKLVADLLQMNPKYRIRYMKAV